MAADNGELKDTGKPKSGKRQLSALDRLIQSAVADNRTLGNDQDPAREHYPVLWDWLTRTSAGVDYIMTSGKFTVVAGPGGFIVTLTHPDLASSIELTTLFLDKLLEQIEAKLNSPDLVIKAWGKKQPTVRKRKQK